MNVHVLCTVLNPALIRSALLFFKTARTGFPRNDIIVHGNGLEPETLPVIRAACHTISAQFIHLQQMPHGAWIETLLASEREPFWICDPDVVLFDDVSQWFHAGDDVLFAGRYEPEYFEKWTQAIHVARLHPSLMWFNPQKLKAAMRGWPGRADFFRTVEMELIRWSFVPLNGKLYFHDTCAGLHQALGGTRFTDEQNAAFEHLFCGSYHDMIEKVGNDNLQAMHAEIFNDPNLARGLWEVQQERYAESVAEHSNVRVPALPCHGE